MSGEYLLMMSIVAMLVVLATAQLWMIRSQRNRMKSLEAGFQSRIAELEAEFNALDSGAKGVGNKVLALEKGVRGLSEKQSEMELRDPGKASYLEASRLAEMGANADDLVAGCGLSRPEAELLASMGRNRGEAIPIVN